jgi:HEPN domain-containing protein
MGEIFFAHRMGTRLTFHLIDHLPASCGSNSTNLNPLPVDARAALFFCFAKSARIFPNGRMETGSRALDWLKQAKADLQWGKDTLSHNHFAQACFIAQQVSEKAIKALAYARGAALVKGHSILATIRDLSLNGELEEFAMRLDQYYISSRYPDAQPAGIPSDYFTAAQAHEAMQMAEQFIARVEKMLADDHLEQG